MRTILTPPCECEPGDDALGGDRQTRNPSPSGWASDDRQAEVAAILALALPVEMPAGSGQVVAGLLRQVVEALSPSPASPGDRAIGRDLQAAADLLDQYGDPNR